MKTNVYRIPVRGSLLVTAIAVLAACSTSNPQAIDYKSSNPNRSKAPQLSSPPDFTAEAADQRSVAPASGQASLSNYQHVEKTVVTPDTVVPARAGLHIERDGTQRWLVVDNETAAQLWPQIRRFWEEQGFLLVVDQRSRSIMETDWNETHTRIDQDLVRNTLTKAMDNSYVTGERNKYRTRLEQGSNGSTLIFISQKGMHEVLTGNEKESSAWREKPNEPGLEAQYLQRLLDTLAQSQSVARQQSNPNMAVAMNSGPNSPGSAVDAAPPRSRRARAAGNLPADSSAAAAIAADSQLELAESYDQAWTNVGQALQRNNFTVDNTDQSRGLYFVRYVDPNDLSSAEQGFWAQVFHGKKEKVALQYRVNVRALTETSTRVAVVDENGNVLDTRPARQIMSLVSGQLVR